MLSRRVGSPLAGLELKSHKAPVPFLAAASFRLHLSSLISILMGYSCRLAHDSAAPMCARASRVFHVATRGRRGCHTRGRTRAHAHARTRVWSPACPVADRESLSGASPEGRSRASSIPEHPPFAYVRRGGKHSSLTARQWANARGGGERILRNPGMTEPDRERALSLPIVRLTVDCARTDRHRYVYTPERERDRRSLANEPRRFLNSKEPGHLRGPDLPLSPPSRPSVPAS